MKKSFIQTLIVVVTVMLSFNTFANNDNPKNTKVEAATDSLRKEVTQLVSNADLWGNDIEEAQVIVQFTINSEGELELKDVNSDSDYLKSFVKEKVDHKKIDVDGVTPQTNYYLKINFKAR